jgi:hypothetical protein
MRTTTLCIFPLKICTYCMRGERRPRYSRFTKVLNAIIGKL